MAEFQSSRRALLSETTGQVPAGSTAGRETCTAVLTHSRTYVRTYIRTYMQVYSMYVRTHTYICVLVW